MSRRVELIYDAGCPHVGPARSALLEAFVQLGLSPAWSEWECSDSQTPAYVRACGSPTVLVDGKDVAEPLTVASGGCCRLYGEGGEGAPSLEALVSALKPSRLVGGRSFLSALPALSAALLPVGVCPACWTLYAGVLSVLGLGFLLEDQYLLPLAIVLLLATLCTLAHNAAARRGYGPLTAGALGALLILFGKFVLASAVVVYTALTVLLAASFWNVWPRAAHPCSRCRKGA